MFEKREELPMSQAELPDKSIRKWGRVKAVVLFLSSTLVILSLPATFFDVQPAEYVFVVSRWMQSSFSSVPCLYVVLNIIILTLGVKSGALTTYTSTSTPTSTSISHCHSSPTQHKTDRTTGENFFENKISRPHWKAEECSDDGSLKAAEAHKASALVLQRSTSFGEFHSKKVTKLSNLSRESTYIQPNAAPVEVIFEICGGEGGDGHCDVENEGSLSCEELNAKAESFIENFNLELKMQREDSWKRLCAIYRQSC